MYSLLLAVVDGPPFHIEETGWGGFNVDIRLFFAPEAGAKAEGRTHFLQLETYGDEANQAKQNQEKMVRSEFLDYVEFNEPTETLYEALTDEGQWPTNKKSRGKGKGKRTVEGDGGDGTVELPDMSTAGNEFSKQLEQQILGVLGRAGKEVEEEIEAIVKSRKELERELKELQVPVTGKQ